MSTELQAFALTNALTEIKNVCPEVSNAFIFREDGTILCKDEDTDAETATRTADALNSLSKRANIIGGLESATFYNGNNLANVFRINDYYIALVGSEEPDGKTVAVIARILIPTVLRLTEEIQNASQGENFRVEKTDSIIETVPDGEENSTELEAEEITDDESEPPEEQSEPEEEPEPLLPEPPVTQFMVENMSRLLVASESVRVDNSVIQQWKDLYEDRAINEVDLETLNGLTVRCKFKPIKGSKHEGRGIIQLPQKIQRTLQTSKGELVMVKPVIE